MAAKEETGSNRAEELAKEVLMLSRNMLLVNLRFLDTALGQFPQTQRVGTGLSTDGQALYYDAMHVLRTYRTSHADVARDYLHLILHCVLRHMFQHKDAEPEIWDIACDIAVEHAITELELNAVSVEREKEQHDICERLQREIGMLTAEKIYRRLLQKPAWLPPTEELRASFHADDHQLWHTDSADARYNQLAVTAEAGWKEISRRMQVDLETFTRRQGDKASALMQNLREVNREAFDYAGFLQRFASRREAMKTDSTEFDYIFYTYGMTLYDNMPLIEPVEYKPVERILDFVLAVDLAGLINAKQARNFLSKTYEVLKTAESVSSKIRLRLLTCSGASVEETAIDNAEALETYLATLRIRERDELDFRPAFLHVEKLVAKHAFRNLKGLIYFTDGLGKFPAKKPDFDAVFVFVNDTYFSPAVPPWAIRLVLQKDEME